MLWKISTVILGLATLVLGYMYLQQRAFRRRLAIQQDDLILKLAPDSDITFSPGNAGRLVCFPGLKIDTFPQGSEEGAAVTAKMTF